MNFPDFLPLRLITVLLCPIYHIAVCKGVCRCFGAVLGGFSWMWMVWVVLRWVWVALGGFGLFLVVLGGFGPEKVKYEARSTYPPGWEPPRLILQLFGVQKYENSWPIGLKFFLGVRNREEFPRKKFKVEKFSEKGRKIEKTAKKTPFFWIQEFGDPLVVRGLVGAAKFSKITNFTKTGLMDI